jgi:hypothetical protein
LSVTSDAAIIGLLGAILGIVVSNMFVALLEKFRRTQRRQDIVCALHAEILAGIAANQKQLSPEERDYALANPTPFQTADQTDFIFESVKADISLLPIEVVHSVVQYYRFAMQTNLMILDFRDPTFKEQSPEEKRKFIASVLDVTDLQFRGGTKALDDLEAFAARIGLDLAEKRRRSVSTANSSIAATGHLRLSGGSDLT